eukprot:gnl/MRDRNA2_/MRDRNA2_14457_c0_seq1.p1 gnl/MRDRNA2_/MRDRNA2_14457_c0~~gnl/MRDRNA2_/MRDRNA2_14457_c0_seq1.p1  ORF type:complete len:443 (-),score=69.49 gnl/MRDRNA2_/MRDRNA2_14457_c0_seq1:98-1426(-)
MCRPTTEAPSAYQRPSTVKAQHGPEEQRRFVLEHDRCTIDRSKGEMWYLVSSLWLSKWKKFIGGYGPPPGPIKNSDLLLPTGQPKPGLKAARDYRGLSPEVWAYLYGIYGGDQQICRETLEIHDIPSSGSPEPDAKVPSTNSSKQSTQVRPAGASPQTSQQRRASQERRGSQDRRSSQDRRRSGSINSRPSRTSGPSTFCWPWPKSSSRATNVIEVARPLGRPGSDSSKDRHQSTMSMTLPPPETEASEETSSTQTGGQRSLQIDASSDSLAGTAPGSVFNGKPVDDGSDIFKDSPGSPAKVVEGELVEQPEDGSCLFHSIAFGIGAGCDAKTLRREIADFIAVQSKTSLAGISIEDWIKWEHDISPRTYAKDLLRPYTWGGSLELAVAAKIKAVNINVYESCQYGKFKNLHEFPVPDAKGTVDVVYRTKPSKHYDALCHKR